MNVIFSLPTENNGPSYLISRLIHLFESAILQIKRHRTWIHLEFSPVRNALCSNLMTSSTIVYTEFDNDQRIGLKNTAILYSVVSVFLSFTCAVVLSIRL